MRQRLWFFAIIAALLIGEAAVLVRQHARAGELRAALARQQSQADGLAGLQGENRRLKAAQPTEQQLADMAAQLVLADQLRSQLTAMQRRVEMAAAKRAPEAQPVITSLVGNSVAAGLWQNAGRATPDAAFQTTLWAAARGDIDALADILVFDAETRRQATAAFDGLPAVLQNELGTPERMIALLTAADVPLGRASILGQYPGAADTRLAVQLIDGSGKASTAVFALQAEADQWQLKVPAAVVKRYAAWLNASQEGAGAGK